MKRAYSAFVSMEQDAESVERFRRLKSPLADAGIKAVVRHTAGKQRLAIKRIIDPILSADMVVFLQPAPEVGSSLMDIELGAAVMAGRPVIVLESGGAGRFPAQLAGQKLVHVSDRQPRDVVDALLAAVGPKPGPGDANKPPARKPASPRSARLTHV